MRDCRRLMAHDCFVVPTQVEKNARRISKSISLRATLFKSRRRQLELAR